MNLADSILPLLNGAEMMIEDGKVQRTVAIGFPRLIDMWAASNVQRLHLMYQEACWSNEYPTRTTDLYAHSLQIVKTIHQSRDISSMAQLSLGQIVLVLRAVGVIIGGISIGEAI